MSWTSAANTVQPTTQTIQTHNTVSFARCQTGQHSQHFNQATTAPLSTASHNKIARSDREADTAGEEPPEPPTG